MDVRATADATNDAGTGTKNMMRIGKGLVIAASIFAGTSSDVSAYSGELYVVCDLDHKEQGNRPLGLRSCGALSCPELRQLDAGTFLQTLEPQPTGGWREVFVLKSITDRNMSISGWLPMQYMCEIRFPGRR